MIGYMLAGIISGIVSGMGIGGGTVLIPVLTLVFGMPQKTAQGINLIYFIPTAVIALFTHLKSRRVETRILKGIIIYGIIGAVTGSLIALKLDGEQLRRMFGVFLFAMGIREIYISRRENMTTLDFEALKKKFEEADLRGKIHIYTTTTDLTQGQYRELLSMYPRDKIAELERAFD